MMEVTINIPGLKELAEALMILAGTKGAAVPQQTASPAVHTAPESVQAPMTAPMPQQASVPQSFPGQTAQPAGNPTPVPVMPAPTASVTPAALGAPAAPVVPTTAVGQAYTQDQLAVAMTGLVDQGKMQAVMGILAQMGAQALTEVPKERYPELVLLLREAGAVI